MSETHKMVLQRKSGAVEWWLCPTCGRLLMIEWDPFSKITVLEGDIYASHTGSKGGVNLFVTAHQDDESS